MGIEEIVRTMWRHIDAKFKSLCDNNTCCCAGSIRPISGEFKETLATVNLEPSLIKVTNVLERCRD